VAISPSDESIIALAGALPIEISGIRGLGTFKKSRLDWLKTYRGDIHGKGVVLFVSGVGGARAYEAARYVTRNFPLSAYISIGLSASLDPSLQPGDVVIGESVAPVDDPADSRIASDAGLLEVAKSALAGLPGCRFGGLVCSAKVVTSAKEKSDIAASSGCLALDMESYGAARAAREAGVPFLAIRAVSDALDEDLPVDFNRFTSYGKMDWPRFLAHVITHPQVIPPLMKLGGNSRKAVRNITGAVGKLILSM